VRIPLVKLWARFVRAGHRYSARLLEEVLDLALLLFKGAALLIRTALIFRPLVASYGAGGFFCPTLELVHRSFALILAAAFSIHVLLLSFSTTRQYHEAPKELPEVSAGLQPI
jgi:hypothetical protein